MTDNLFDGKNIILTEDQWKQKLSSLEYKILREKGTEPPFSNKYYYHKEKGTYYCTACQLALFSSKDKYDSESGWPSFTKPIHEKNISNIEDPSHEMKRIETKCARCNSHLGHVFDDGPTPTGKRYCINSTALKFHKD